MAQAYPTLRHLALKQAANPDMKLGELAMHFHVPMTWVQYVTGSDAYKAMVTEFRKFAEDTAKGPVELMGG